MDEKIIPFGKHKGKPIEILANDQQYLDWLLAQSWFKEKHINLYNVVINNCREPTDTPEHNKIQIRFLKLEQRLKLALLVNPNLLDITSINVNQALKDLIERSNKTEQNYILNALQNPDQKSEFGLYDIRLLKDSKPTFERVDVQFSFWNGIEFHYENSRFQDGWSRFNKETKSSYFIEIKPTISDDYPAVLRQMKASMSVNEHNWSEYYFILLVGNYTGVGATRDEFIAFFETQGYRVIFVNQLDQMKLPEFKNKFILDQELVNELS